MLSSGWAGLVLNNFWIFSIADMESLPGENVMR